jgi:predicted nucleic acid-binding protein
MRISNATPLIAFARIGELALLARLVQRLAVPEAVWHEVTDDPTQPGAEAIRQATWIDVYPVTTVPVELLALLDRGEAEVIALAEAHAAQEVLLDERAARAIAIARGLPVIGTAGLLVRAKQQGMIPAVEPVLTRMQAQGVRYSQTFVAALLQQLGE